MVALSSESDSTCPLINLDDHRCAQRLRLGDLHQAFDLCVNGKYHQCPTYHQLKNRRNSESYIASIEQRRQRERSNACPIALTVGGRSIEPPIRVGSSRFFGWFKRHSPPTSAAA